MLPMSFIPSVNRQALFQPFYNRPRITLVITKTVWYTLLVLLPVLGSNALQVTRYCNELQF